MYILGLTTLGDSAATLIRDGEIVAAAEEERFSRRKHHSGFPYQAMQYCLDEARITIKDIAHIGLYWKPWVLRHKALQAIKSGLISRDMFHARVDRGVAQVSESYLGMLRYPHRIREHFGASEFKFHFLEHHQCHAASAFFVSGFERAAIMTWDGTGEDTTTLFSQGDDTRLRILKRIKLPHSLGQFYSAVTNYLGFDMFEGDEWKVMGLAAYGKPEYYDFFARRVLTANGDHDFHFNIRVLDHHLAKHYQFRAELTQALGAALMVWHTRLKQPRRFRMEHAYYGPGFSSEECAAALREAGLKFETLADEELLPRVARLIADGAIIGWFQGRMEFGPRALGNRSFIADPRRADMRDLLNQKVKLREWFRPL